MTKEMKIAYQSWQPDRGSKMILLMFAHLKAQDRAWLPKQRRSGPVLSRCHCLEALACVAGPQKTKII